MIFLGGNLPFTIGNPEIIEDVFLKHCYWVDDYPLPDIQSMGVDWLNYYAIPWAEFSGKVSLRLTTPRFFSHGASLTKKKS